MGLNPPGAIRGGRADGDDWPAFDVESADDLGLAGHPVRGSWRVDRHEHRIGLDAGTAQEELPGQLELVFVDRVHPVEEVGPVSHSG
jgi:hypothetical protein